MSATGYRVRIALFTIALTLVVVNAFALWGEERARQTAAILELTIGAGAVIYGLIAAAQVRGVSRTWRLVAVASLAGFLIGDLAWWTNWEALRLPGVIAYFLFPILALASVLLLSRAGGGVTGPPDGSLSHTVVITSLDGLVAGTSFAILVIIGGFGIMSLDSLPRSGNAAVDTVYALLELALVVFAAVIGMVYQPHQPYRANYLMLACGVVMIAASDRVVAYFCSVGERGEVWGTLGFILGPLFIAFALREVPAEVRAPRQGMDWAQVVLPYTGFLGITVLLSYHVLNGNRLSAVVVGATMLTAILVAARQVVAMDAQRRLTRRLYDAQRSLAHQVYHDALTGLPNRLLLAQRLDDAMHEGNFVLIFVDLDDFKEVNDRFGHAAGDDLLCAVGERLMRCVTDADTLARIGGDEFAILIEGQTEEPEVVADRLRVALRDPFAVHGSSVRVRASMGLVRSGADGGLLQTSDDLLRQADISMYAGKRLGKNTAVVYQPSAGVQADFPTALRKADGGIPTGFSLVFQPVVRLPDGTPLAVEALSRWAAPNGIQISPETFVAVAEAAGLGATMDAMVLDMACGQVEAADLDVDIHVNIGAARLGNPGFEQHIRKTLTRHRIPPNRLVMEITETVPIVDLADAAAQIRRLNALGVKVALDDFGAGYNSLTYLHSLPVQIVKLDRSLAVGADSERDLALYRSVIGLCDALHLEVIAEGIETPEQADTVYEAGCRLAQGHLFGLPVPITELNWDSMTRSGPA